MSLPLASTERRRVAAQILASSLATALLTLTDVIMQVCFIAKSGDSAGLFEPLLSNLVLPAHLATTTLDFASLVIIFMP